MTKLLQEAFTLVSTQLNQQDQDKLAHLMIENIGKLQNLLEDEAEEKRFDASALEAIGSETVQNLLSKVAEKYSAHYTS